ncbi:VOC family protein [Roseicella frigidaeris]|uniref:Glyoxalase n=1 Tax=Roseicella frigidaeris TaxID=2230885 RepID=A0A327MCI6_9PROT|nr:VOC family protein [Roseicella frigidaeris]RAI59753.1 glyoxalase [Roseicella frigidaeris]
MPRLSHQLETSLYVADLARSEDFYRTVFGFETFLRDDRMIGMGVPGGSVLLLFRHGGSVTASPTPAGDIPPHDARGQQHLAFAIPRGELEAWEEHLRSLAVPLESRVTWPRGGVSLYFRDPDEHSLEVATPGLWPSY